MLKRTLSALLVAGCCVFAAALQAQQAQQGQQFIYKWTDDRGMIQYSELPPPTGVKYEMVSKTSGTGQKNAEEGARDLNKEQADLAKQVEEQEKKQQEETEKAQKEAEDVRTKNCEAAKKNLKILQGDGAVVKTDAKGNKIALDPQQREEELKKAQKDQDYFCNP
ncbi:MAG: DUF4124 domain-containing protein [Candidatus Competibacteraceae bacterium]|nr:DUF4124 domain-containing protein [Candidatus Competibacteraceae bacterium]